MFLLLAYHLIGTQPFCTLNVNTKVIECNYETMGDCEGYRADVEQCIPNPQFPK